MAGHRLRALRRRLTYANVMATLAFFFALTGGAFATAAYLRANTPITRGDLAGSTYGKPLIANGKITTAKFKTSAIAPNAARLGGLNVTTATLGAPFTIPASSPGVIVAGCPSDRVPIHVARLNAGPDIHVTEEDWSGLFRHSDLQVHLENTGAQGETFNSVTLDCFGAG